MATEIDINGDGGILKLILTQGHGDESPPKNSRVKVHYVGTLLDGTKFDSSRDRSDPFEFNIGKGSVIKAWDEGVATMKRGEIAVLTCAPEYAYGAAGSPPKIPANATLKFEVELIDWDEKIDVTNDKGVMKKILSAASDDQHQTPNDFAVCEVSYTLKCGDTVLAEREKCSIEISVDITICEGLDKTIKSMKQGEKCVVTIAPEYGYGVAGDVELGVPANATLEAIIEMHSFVRGADKWALKLPEKIAYAEKRKQAGNSLFKQGRFSGALKHYQGAFELIQYEKELGDSSAKEMLANLHGNQGACNLKLKNWAAAKTNCDDALKADAKNVKALFRRAQAALGMSAPEQAKADLLEVLKLDARNAAAKDLLSHVKALLKKEQEKERSTYGGIFEKLAKMDVKKVKTSKTDVEMVPAERAEESATADEVMAE